MKRSAIQLANNTLVMSLPAKWVQQNNVAKGSLLDIDMKEKLLIVRADSSAAQQQRRIKVDISGMNATLVWNLLDVLYRTGASEIEVFFSEQSIRNIKTGEVKKTIDLLSRVADKLIGMEIISQSRNSCLIKEVTQSNSDEYGNILNRIFLSIITISEDILAAAKKQDRETLENIHLYSEVNVNKLSDYCMRMLNLKGLKDFKESNSNYVLTFILEEVGDAYAEIARMLSKDARQRTNAAFISIYSEVHNLLLIAHKFLLNPKKEYYISFHEERNSVKKKIGAISSSSKQDSEAFFLLKLVLDRLMEVTNAKVTAVEVL